MGWIKRNLFFVISVAIGLALTGYCGYLLYSALDSNSGVSDEYKTTLASLETINQKLPFPSKENIQIARADQAKVTAFLADFRGRFQGFPLPPPEDDKGFSQYLEDSLVRFRGGATNAGVQLPPDYDFSFSSLRGKLNYPPGAIVAWMQQLQEISAILNILYAGKINFLQSLCRVPVSADDAGSGDCLLQTVPVTNVWGVVTPYKITFRGFSEELAAVMDGFARSSNCFIIKSVEVSADKTASVAEMSQATPESEPPMMAFNPAPRMPNPVFSRLPGLAGLRSQPPPVTPAPRAQTVAPVTPSGPVIVLREEPLSVTLLVDAVKLKAEHP